MRRLGPGLAVRLAPDQRDFLLPQLFLELQRLLFIECFYMTQSKFYAQLVYTLKFKILIFSLF